LLELVKVFYALCDLGELRSELRLALLKGRPEAFDFGAEALSHGFGRRLQLI
jgi:hypothetical protein